MRWTLSAFTVALILVLGVGLRPSDAGPFSLSGGYTGVVGYWVSTAWTTGLVPDTTLAYGLTFTKVQGTEVLVSLTDRSSLPGGWNISFTASRGGLGGDYLVDRLPEITLWRTAPLVGSFLTYTLEAGVGNFTVHPPEITGFRGTGAMTVSTSQISLTPDIAISASLGYRQNVYPSGGSHSAWWGSPQLFFTFSPSLSSSFTYFRQDQWSTSPLLFDTMGASNYLQGSVRLTPSQGLTIGHSQTYDFLSQGLSQRSYSLSLALSPGVVGGLGWDDVTRQITVSLSTPEIGYASIILEVPTGRVFFSFSR